MLPTSTLIVLICSSWGFFAHRHINQFAVFTLPTEMIGFYKRNSTYLGQHASDPDKRRYVDPEEASRHFLDADRYGAHPFDSIPEQWQAAVERYTEETLNKNGTVPWTIEKKYYQLVHAFKEKDASAILKISADLGHYIGDAHVPLHMTENYNGQLSNQVGIHALWESRLPELFTHEYNFFVGKASYIVNPRKSAWAICRSTFKCVDSVLSIEKKLHASFPSDKKYTFSKRKNQIRKEYSMTYARAYHTLLQGMVERQMRLSILAIGSYWYSAWVDAGQLNLEQLKVPASIHQTKKNSSVVKRQRYKMKNNFDTTNACDRYD